MLVMLLLAACTGGDGGGDVTGPFSGTRRRYVVDGFTLPTTNSDARALGDDLNGDGVVDNQLGMVIATLDEYDDITTHAADMIAAGAITSSVVIRADDFVDDESVSVVYFGADGDPATEVGGRFENGTFVSNRTRSTDVPGDAVLRLPIFADTDPSEVPMFAMEMSLTPNGTGFDAAIAGAVLPTIALDRTYEAIMAMVAAAPDRHRLLMKIFDENMDWALTKYELERNDLLTALLDNDVTLFGQKAVSFGFHVHLSPCDAGTCAGDPENTCFDRVLDGNETDVDCGGSCRTCSPGATCEAASDCISAACDSGQCRATTCGDGARDAFETDVDCGGNCGATCDLGARCFGSADCASGNCVGGDVLSYVSGRCQPAQ